MNDSRKFFIDTNDFGIHSPMEHRPRVCSFTTRVYNCWRTYCSPRMVADRRASDSSVIGLANTLQHTWLHHLHGPFMVQQSLSPAFAGRCQECSTQHRECLDRGVSKMVHLAVVSKTGGSLGGLADGIVHNRETVQFA